MNGSANHPRSESFVFDATGNRSSQTNGTGSGTSSQTDSVTKNRLTNDGTYSYTYDNEGNVTRRTKLSDNSYEQYTWDHRDRMVQVDFKTSSNVLQKQERFHYDAFNRRVMSEYNLDGNTTFEKTERYVYDGGDAIALVLTATTQGTTPAGTVTHRFLNGPDIDQVFADESSNGLFWYLTDNQNTVRDVVNNSGTVVNHLTYSSFGKITSETDGNKTPFFAYTSKPLDELTGFQFNWNRWYNPATGRWQSEDPIRVGAGDPNIQRYVSNSPTNYTDPSGLAPKEWQTPEGAFNWTMQRIAQLEALLNDLDENNKNSKGEKIDDHVIDNWEKELANWEQWADRLAPHLNRPNGPSFMDPWEHDGLNKLADDPKELQRRFAQELIEAGKEFGEYAQEYAKERAIDYAKGVALGAAAHCVDRLVDKAIDFYRMRRAYAKRFGCFPAGTLVATEQGLIPIETIPSGMKVWAFDLSRAVWELRPVLRTMRHSYENDFATLELGGESMTATGNHPFWVVEGEGLSSRPACEHTAQPEDPTEIPGRWVDARDLLIGDVLVSRTNHVARLTAKAVFHQAATVYNVEVADFNSYAIGTTQVLVHNKSARRGQPLVGTQDHHGIPWDNKTWNHQKHPLVKQAGNPNLKTMPGNLRALEGHAGRHSTSYHQEVRRRMDEGLKRVTGKGPEAAQAELRNVIKGIWDDIASGKLRPYDHKDVILPR